MGEITIEPILRINDSIKDVFMVYCESRRRHIKVGNIHEYYTNANLETYTACKTCENKECRYHYTSENTWFGRDKCSCCGNHLISVGFTIIFNKLKEAGLLQNDYKPICCYCYKESYRKKSDMPHEFLNHR